MDIWTFFFNKRVKRFWSLITSQMPYLEHFSSQQRVRKIITPSSFRNAPSILPLSRRHRILCSFKIKKEASHFFFPVMIVTDFMHIWMKYFWENTMFPTSLVFCASTIRSYLKQVLLWFLFLIQKSILQNS